MTETSRPRNRSRRLNVVIGLVVSAACLFWVFYTVDSNEIFTAVKQVRREYVFWAILATVFSYILRAARWPVFFKFSPPRFRDSYRCVILGFFMNNVLPARIGELVRAHLGGRATSQSRTYVLATIAAERLVDGLTISTLFVLLFTFASTPVERTHGDEIFLVAYMFGAVAVATAVVLLFRQRLFNSLERLGGIIPGHLSQYTLLRIQRFIEGLEPLFYPRRAVVILAWSIAVWSVELLVYRLVAEAYGVELSLGALSLFLAAVNFSSLIPAAPGGIGVIEFFAVLGLQQIGIERETALVMVATQHIIQIGVIGLPGILYLIMGIGERLTPQDDELEDDLPGGSGSERLERSTSEVPIDRSVSAANAPYLSIVLPAYNEEHRLPRTLLSILEYVRSRSESFEIIVVDDGSTDGTAGVVQSFSNLAPQVRLIRYPENRGKGYAVRTGMLAAQGRYALYNDADGSTPIGELSRLEEGIRAGGQIAIGSRALFSRDTTVSTVWYRKFMGRIFNATVNFLILPGIADTQCGFKLFERTASQYIFSRQRAERFSFDVEVLYIARKAGYQIAEVPINWVNVPGSKVHLIKDSFQMLVDVFRVRARSFVGGYRVPRAEPKVSERSEPYRSR